MNATMLCSKISALPPSMIKEVNDFVEFLKTKQKKIKLKKENLVAQKD
jgi:hypothetical protein